MILLYTIKKGKEKTFTLSTEVQPSVSELYNLHLEKLRLVEKVRAQNRKRYEKIKEADRTRNQDTNVKGSRFNLITTNKLDGPEELHLMYVNLNQQKKNMTNRIEK